MGHWLAASTTTKQTDREGAAFSAFGDTFVKESFHLHLTNICEKQIHHIVTPYG
jgi:hypothetical protein